MGAPLPCANWSGVPLASGPGIAYMAMARTGSGSLRAVLANLYGMERRKFPHDHSCTLRGLASRHPDARRVIVPLRLLHDRIVSWFARSQHRNCRPPAYKPACVPPLREAPERFMRGMMRFALPMANAYLKPANSYVNLNLSFKHKNIDVRFVCTCQLRAHVTRTLEAWNVPGADAAWEGIEDRHVTDTNTSLPRLSDAAIDFLRQHFHKDYAIVEAHGCGERDCDDTPKEGAALARVAHSRSVGGAHGAWRGQMR